MRRSVLIPPPNLLELSRLYRVLVYTSLLFPDFLQYFSMHPEDSYIRLMPHATYLKECRGHTDTSLLSGCTNTRKNWHREDTRVVQSLAYLVRLTDSQASGPAM